jgi:hypothetical protein
MYTAVPSALVFAIAMFLLPTDAGASSCTPTWELASAYHVRRLELQKRLDVDVANELRKYANLDEWRMMIAGAHILIEATPVRMVDVRNHDPGRPMRRIVEYRNVTWLRDLRVGATRPDRITIGVTYTWCDVCNTIVPEDRETVFDGTRHILPADPNKRYVIGLTIEEPQLLHRFANSLTDPPIADMGDPTNGCTTSFYINAARPTKVDPKNPDGWGSQEHWDMGDRLLARFRQHPQLR